MKKLIFTVGLILFSFGVFSQNTVQQSKKNDGFHQARLKKSTKLNQNNNTASSNYSVPNPDGYMGKKQEFLSKLNVNELPEDFPKYKNEYKAEEYLIIVKNWMKNHPELVKNEN